MSNFWWMLKNCKIRRCENSSMSNFLKFYHEKWPKILTGESFPEFYKTLCLTVRCKVLPSSFCCSLRKLFSPFFCLQRKKFQFLQALQRKRRKEQWISTSCVWNQLVAKQLIVTSGHGSPSCVWFNNKIFNCIQNNISKMAPILLEQ